MVAYRNAAFSRDDGLDVPGAPSTPVGTLIGGAISWAWRGREDGGSAITVVRHSMAAAGAELERQHYWRH